MKALKLDLDSYRDLLKQYITTQDETALYQAEQFSKLSLKHNISPDEIIDVHIQALKQLYPNLSSEVDHSLKFLLEAMISYGLAYQEHQSLREQQLALKSEIAIAADMQQTLLTTEKPKVHGIDIGVISVPAHQMNGDYYNFVSETTDCLGVAIADVIGKGIPAALAMSMIKYSMDSFSENLEKPRLILESLNRVVEQNVDPGMFITMFYGFYNSRNNCFTYSSAGHEPGFYYSAKTDTWNEMKTKGLVLGVARDTIYSQYEMELKKDDVIVLLTDGVTECRVDDHFIGRDEIINVIHNYMHLPMQQAVEQVFKHFERLQSFQLRDDFTLLMIRREV